jgi:hypothetical protein
MESSKFGQEMKEEGRLEGRQEGQLVTRRADILAVLEEKFGAATRREFEPALNALADFDRLGQLLRLAGAAPNVDRFRRALAQAETTS